MSGLLIDKILKKNINMSNKNINLLTVSKDPLAKSIMPAVGLATNPTAPFPRPLKKPSTPCSLAPDIGFVNTPVTPSKTPYN